MADNLRQKLINEYIQSLQEDIIPWERGWSSNGAHRNATTQKPYQGMNTLLLQFVAMNKGYTDPRWCTYVQAKNNGWQVKKGEKGTQLERMIFYDKANKKTLENENECLSLIENGRPESDFVKYYRTFTVFNAQQIDGITPLDIEYHANIESNEIIDRMIQNMGIGYLEQGEQAYYLPSADTVTVPKKEYFKSSYEYNATRLHEMCHASGHSSRLNRDMTGRFGSENYAKEELRAEIASSFIMQDLGLEYGEYHIKNHKAYIQSWIKVLQNNPNELFDAIKDANGISNYMREQGEYAIDQFIQGKEVAPNLEQKQTQETIVEPSITDTVFRHEPMANSSEENICNGIIQNWLNDHLENGDDWDVSFDEGKGKWILDREDQQSEFRSAKELLNAIREEIIEDVYNHVDYLDKGQLAYMQINEPEPLNLEDSGLNEQDEIKEEKKSPLQQKETKKIDYKNLIQMIESQIAITDVVRDAGFSLVRNGSKSFRTEEHDSLVLDTMNNRFYWNSKTPLPEDIERAKAKIEKTGKGHLPSVLSGGVIKFYQVINNISFKEAMEALAKRIDITLELPKEAKDPPKKREITEIERHTMLREQLIKNKYQNIDMQHTKAYLIKTRQIDPEIVDLFIKRNMIFQTQDDQGRTQAVFLGRNENGYLCSACFRTTSSQSSFKGDYSGCDYDRGWFFEPTKDISFNYAQNAGKANNYFDTNKTLLVFESNIEMMSYMSILKMNNLDINKFAYLSCGSIAKSNSVEATCETYGYKKAVIMFNNDFDKKTNWGLNKALYVVDQLKQKGIEARALVPSQCNDWNDTLVAYKKKEIELNRDRRPIKEKRSLDDSR